MVDVDGRSAWVVEMQLGKAVYVLGEGVSATTRLLSLTLCCSCTRQARGLSLLSVL